MESIKRFFLNLGFNFTKDLELKEYSIGEKKLQNKLKGNLYFYQGKNSVNTTFYLILAHLSENELNEIRTFIWNQNLADLLFIASDIEAFQSSLFDDNTELTLYYAKGNPKVKLEEYLVDSFITSQTDLDKIEKIKKWQFDSGSFWLNYEDFLKKVEKTKTIDRVLIDTLLIVKEQLFLEIGNEEVVQALIDRTLYIKYLEENHIINSYFYNYYFGNSNLSYKKLLEGRDTELLNKLFKIIHAIFNSSLFDNPKINNEYLTDSVCNFLYHSISGTNLKNNLLSLFDFKFNIIPVEFISYIYEIFLSNEQKENGIYYTPKKLAQLIIDDVIPQGKIGRVLDPSCGSGMFLIVAYQKLLENCNNIHFTDVEEEINFRIKLLADNIFGIEKQLVAQRFTIFSLSLQIFRDLEPEKIKDYIAKELEEKGKVNVFNNYDFYKNIIRHNSLDTRDIPFEGYSFDYIVGNPPFFEIKQKNEEILFLNEYKLKTKDGFVRANRIVGKHQISQCFFIKIKDWSNEYTRFGFVSNSSNFYNSNSDDFQSFFYLNYGIEKIYELSKVKQILFEKAKEDVVALIFNNQPNTDRLIKYYPVEMGLFSEKPFELLIIQEDNVIELNQTDLLNNVVRLRDFLSGNEYDRALVNYLEKFDTLDNYLKRVEGTTKTISNGLQIVGKEQLIHEFNISESNWNNLTKSERDTFSEKFKLKYTRNTKDSEFDTPLIQPRNIIPFGVKDTKYDVYLGDISNFQRTRNEKIYSDPKILINRVGRELKATYVKDKIYFNFDIYSISPKEERFNYLLVAIINSQLVNYFIDLIYRSRIGGTFPKIGYDAINQIPIPKELDEDLVEQINSICISLINGNFDNIHSSIKDLNELIFDLYELSFWEKQRIKDYFITDNVGKITSEDEDIYRNGLLNSIAMYFNNPLGIEFYKGHFNLNVVKIYLNGSSKETPTSKHTSLYILNEIFNLSSSRSFLVFREMIFGNDCVYILRKNKKSNWTQTKAFEDGQNILKRLRNAE
jgi:type I restriction-modification system DNA methylase subunit